MKITQTALPGVAVVETTPFADHRGDFACLYDERDLAPVIGGRRIEQVNHSRLGITWPLPVKGLSRRDASFLPIALNFAGIAT